MVYKYPGQPSTYKVKRRKCSKTEGHKPEMLQKTMSTRVNILREGFLRMIEDGTPVWKCRRRLRVSGAALRNYVLYSKSKGLIPDDYKPSVRYRNILSAKVRLLKMLGNPWEDLVSMTSLNKSTIHAYLHNEDVVYGIGKVRFKAVHKIVTKQSEIEPGTVFDVTVLNERGEIKLDAPHCSFYGEAEDIKFRIHLVTAYPVCDDFEYPVLLRTG